MDTLKLILKNLDDILVVVALIVAILLGVVRFVAAWVPKWKAMPTEERVAYIRRLLENLIPVALRLVMDAEVKYGPGTGAIKRAEVIDELYLRIPDEYKKDITEDNLEAILKAGLAEAEHLIESDNGIRAYMDIYTKAEQMGFRQGNGSTL